MGLCVFEHLPEIIKKTEKRIDFYTNNLNFDNISTIKIRENTQWNYHYYPVIFESETKLLEVQKSSTNIKFSKMLFLSLA